LSDGATALDVAIVGGGLAGNLLARQLHRRAPQLRVGMFEMETRSSYKVGEATVEITANHLIRKQGLSQYLYEKQLPKNGLRYFFDEADCSAPLEEMSEIGTVNLPYHPAFQLDRAALETDLLEMNREAGLHIRRGEQVRNIQFGSTGQAHRFESVGAAAKTAYEARWIVDAAGRRRLFAGQKGLRVPEDRHRVGSVWGRFENVVDIDEYGSEAFRARVRHTSRRLSTIHFWYPGYWIWFIPLRGGMTSVGVTGEEMARNKELRTPEGFRDFLDRHRAVRDLLAGAKGVDVGSYTQIAYGTRQFFSAKDRWALTGEAATSADPLYSPGSDFIALENDYVTDLIVRDLVEGDAEAVAERALLYDDFMRFRYEATMLLYQDLYAAQGSFELCSVKWVFDIACYYNLWVDSYMGDKHLDPEYLRQQLRLEGFILQALRNFRDLFRKVEQHLREGGNFFRRNSGEFYYGLADIDFAETIGGELRSEEEVMAKTAEIFNVVRGKCLVLLDEADSEEAVEPLPLAAFLGRRAIG
jgi:flavin-dependent dehydrogenase